MSLSTASATLHTGRFEHHLLNRNQKRGAMKKALVVGLMLTSLVDMFSMLVCFLLQTFSTTPEVFVANDIRLPEAVSGGVVKEAPVLSMSRTMLFLDQKEIGTVEAVLKKPDTLLKGLEGFKQGWAKANPGKPYPGEINLQADREVPSTNVAKLMGILNSQQYDVIQLAVSGGQ